MSGEDEVEGAAGKGINVTVSEAAVDRIVDTGADILKPFAQGLGWFGDWLGQHREVQAAKLGQRALELIPEGEVVKPVPPKLLIPLIERASLEDPGDEELMDAWASLLAQSSIDYRPEMPSYVSVLSQLTSVHARALEAIAMSNLDSKNGWILDHGITNKMRERTWDELSHLLALQLMDSSDPHSLIKSTMQRYGNQRGILTYLTAAYDKESNKIAEVKSGVAGEIGMRQFIHALSVLKNVGLIHEGSSIYDGFDGDGDNGVDTDIDIDDGVDTNIDLDLDLDLDDGVDTDIDVIADMAFLTRYGRRFAQTCIPSVVASLRRKADETD